MELNQIWLSAACIAGVTGLYLAARRAGIKRLEQWDTYGICDCGRRFRAPFGHIFFINEEVCPDCGQSKERFALTTSRCIKGIWEDR